MRYRLTAILSIFILVCALNISCFAECTITATRDTVTASDVPSGGTVIAAIYDANMLTGVRMYRGSGTVLANFRNDMSEVVEKADTLKVFVWNTEKLLPLFYHQEYIISELPSVEETDKMKINAGGKEFTATLENNETAKALKAMLPMTIDMSELNGNEKYYYLPESLPTNTERIGTIHSGDIMLYGSSCIVIFYETFDTSYSYTRIGHIDDISELKSALGTDGVSVKLEI